MGYSGLGKLREALTPGTFTDGDAGPPAVETNTAADLPNAQLLDAIAEADSIIDAALGGRYAVPVTAVGSPPATPHPLDYWSRSIAAYLATCTYRKSQDFSNDDPVYRRYATATAALDAVAKGTYALPGLAQNTSTGAGAGAAPVINTYGGKLFGPDDFNLTPTQRDVGVGRWWGPGW